MRFSARRSPLSPALVIGLVVALALAATPLRVAAVEDIVVGATVPMTGAFAASGIQYYNALLLAQDDINAAGGINGRKLRIAFEDTGANNSTAVNAFVKLMKQYKPPFVFISSLSTQALAMEPEIARAKVATMYGGGAMSVQARGNPWMFRIRPDDSLQAAAIAYCVAEVLKKKRPGILYAQDDFGLGSATAIEALLAKVGVTVVAKEAVNPRDNDFTAQLLNLASKNVDSIVSVDYNRDGALILKQRRGLGLDVPLVSASSMVAPSTLALVDADDLLDVHSTADAVLGDSVSPASGAFVKRYIAAFKLRPDPFGAAYYDGAMMLADALRKVGPDAAKLRDYLSRLRNFDGVVRRYSTDPATNNMAHSVVLVDFKPGTKDFFAVFTYPKP
jgi:branched-chain amino acid transport system substrate-binding protein